MGSASLAVVVDVTFTAPDCTVLPTVSDVPVSESESVGNAAGVSAALIAAVVRATAAATTAASMVNPFTGSSR